MARRGTKLTFEKRKRELDKKKKRQEKLERKRSGTDEVEEIEGAEAQTDAVEEIDPIEAMFKEALRDEEDRKPR